MLNPILMSIKPKFSHKIITQNKKIEIRKKIGVNFEIDNFIYIYSSSPEQCVIGFFQIEKIFSFDRYTITKNILQQSCLSEEEMMNYIGNDIAYGIYIKNVKKINPITIQNMRSSIDKFTPPQSYRYISGQLKEYIDKNISVIP